MQRSDRIGFLIALAAMASLLEGCGGGTSDPAAPANPPVYTVGGSVTGLAGSGLVLQNNGGGDLPVGATGNFTFAGSSASGAAYAVTVKSQPSTPSQTCVVNGGAGTIASANVTNVSIACTTSTFTVGGQVTGLAGIGVVLRNNGADSLSISANGPFTFATRVASGGAYAVTVFSAPISPKQSCDVSNGTGTVAAAAVANVQVTCTMPPPRFAYVGSHAGIYCYAIDPASGALTALAANPCDSGIRTAVAVEPTGRFAYATTVVGSSSRLRAYRVDASTGALTALAATDPDAGSNAVAVTVDPAGHFVYAGDYAGAVRGYVLDASSGALTPIAGSPWSTGVSITGVSTVTVSPSGAFLYATNDVARNVSAFAIDRSSGALTPVPGSPFGTDLGSDFAIDPTGRFAFVPHWQAALVSVFTIDAATGALADAGNAATPAPPGGVVVTDSGKFLYTMDANANSVSAFSVNATSGALTPVAGSPYPVLGTPSSGTSHGNVLHVTSSGNGTVSTFAIQPTTGALVQVAGSPVPASGSGTTGTYRITLAY